MKADTKQERLKEAARRFLEKVLPRPRPFGVRFWDGSLLPPEPPHEDAIILVLKRPEVLARLLDPPLDLALGEAYLEGDFDIEGDLVYVPGTRFTRVALAVRVKGLRGSGPVTVMFAATPASSPVTSTFRLPGTRRYVTVLVARLNAVT